MTRQRFLAVTSSAMIFTAYSASAQSTAHSYAKRYDSSGRLVGSISPDADAAGGLTYLAVRNTYDDAGRLAKIETGALATWQNESVDPAKWAGFDIFERAEIQYDSSGRKVLEKRSGKGNLHSVNQFSYNKAGLLECTAVRIDPASFPLKAPDACKQIVGAVNTYDQISKILYNSAGEIVDSLQAVDTVQEQITSHYTYSSVGKRKSITDANGNRADIEYDGYGRQAKWVFPSSTTIGSGAANGNDYIEYGYDDNNNQVLLRKRDETITKFEYDALNRMVAKIVPEQMGSRSVFYTYDAASNQNTACFDKIDGPNCVQDGYDGFGNIISSRTIMSPNFNQQITYDYDKNGNRISLHYPDTKKVAYEFDNLNRLINIFIDDYKSVSGSYNQIGNISEIDTGSSLVSYTYDQDNRVEKITYSVLDMITSLKYNGLGKIDSVKSNRNELSSPDVVNGARLYKVNGLNQYTESGPVTFRYDRNGNIKEVIKNGLTVESYLYDSDNRLIRKVSTSGSVTTTDLKYDPMGRLWGASTDNVNSTYFLHDGNKVVLEYGSDTSISRRYVYGMKRSSPILWYEGKDLNDRRVLATNLQGSVVAVIGQNGQITFNAFDDFGIPAKRNIGMFQFTGYLWLNQLGLYYSKARIYSPTLGRFLQIDPIGYEDQTNLYAYAGNDPVNNIDPLGLYTCAAHSSSSQCRIADMFVQGVKAAAARRSASEQIKSLAETLGKKGDKGVEIDFGALADGTLGQQSGSTVILDIDQINSQANVIANTFGITSYEALHKLGSSVVAHETKHYEDRNLFGPDAEGIVTAEKRAYRVGDEVERLLNLPGNRLSLGMSAYDYSHSVARRALKSCVSGLITQGMDERVAQASCSNQF